YPKLELPQLWHSRLRQSAMLSPPARRSSYTTKWVPLKFQVFIRNRRVRARVQQLEQATDRLVDRIRVAARQGPAKEDAVLQLTPPALVPQLAPALGQEVADQAEVVGHQVLVDLGHVPTRQERIDAVHEGA